jgi:hypothetical protein
MTDPDILTEFVDRYHTRMVGVKPSKHTCRYIRELFVKAIDGLISLRKYYIHSYLRMFRCEEINNEYYF